MIIMVNGAFGVGKTSAANRLVEEIPNSMLFDPEEIGFMLMKMVPPHMREEKAGSEDFQDLSMWRDWTITLAERFVNEFGKHLIVPMTIRRPDYLEEIRSGFEATGEKTFHFCLTASKETIHNRLRKRGEEDGNWVFRQTDKCVDAFALGGFDETIDTEHRTTEEIIGYIISKTAGVNLMG